MRAVLVTSVVVPEVVFRFCAAASEILLLANEASSALQRVDANFRLVSNVLLDKVNNPLCNA